MRRNRALIISYRQQVIGRLAMTKNDLCAFEYDLGWLANGFSLSPFKLPLEKKVFMAKRDPFDGNFGVFADSLPDGWGRLLIDRMLIKKRINPAEVSVLERLAIVGKSGMGALEYHPETILTNSEISDGLDQLAAECEKILNRKYDGKLEELVKAGGSSGGARPKVLVGYNNEDWIVKFPSLADDKDIGRMEYDYSVLAKKAKLDMPETKLFEDKYFGVKRFDRYGDGGKIHMLSAGGLLDASHRFPTLDYVDLLKATHLLTRDYREIEKLFRLMCFNIFAHNRDDHAKNFSFLYVGDKWQVSPPYDLVYAEGPAGEHTTTVAGEGKNPTQKDILKVAHEVGITAQKARQISEEVRSVF
jgi:serine/threonine-protein kinase HipA